MVETHISLSVNRLLNEDTYAIPLYQRNFAWTYNEIEQLLNDVADAFKKIVFKKIENQLLYWNISR